jgi:hypothetical protein
MKARSRELLDRAIAAMVAAIDVYNKPDFVYRAESFTILALNGWELLLKAKWLSDHNNKLNCLYVPKNNTPTNRTAVRYKRTRSDSHLTHAVDYLAKKLAESRVLDENARKDLEALEELRDTCVHFYHGNSSLAERVQEVGMACLKNFVSAVQDWFDEDLSRFNFYLMPLSFIASPRVLEAVELNRNERSFLEYLDRLTPTDDDPTARYVVTVNIEVRFVRSRAPNAVPVQVTRDPNAPAVRLTEEQIRERYPWDYTELTKRCRERYHGFKVNDEYHQIRRNLEDDERFARVRYLDPANSRSLKKTFYNPDILSELDTHFTRIASR